MGPRFLSFWFCQFLPGFFFFCSKTSKNLNAGLLMATTPPGRLTGWIFAVGSSHSWFWEPERYLDSHL